MLVVLRILLGFAFIYIIKEGREFAVANPESGDLTSAGYVALSVILAIFNALVWAPYFGEKISDPLTGTITRGTYVERRNWLLLLIAWLQSHGWRRGVVFCCFLEGIHHPDRPTAFVLGLKHARPGSWLEKVYAREVFRFDNAQNCIHAYQALRRRGINPGLHHNPEINMVLLSLDRSVKPDPAKLVVTMAPPPPSLKRNRRIKLFGGAPEDVPVTGAEETKEAESSTRTSTTEVAANAGDADRSGRRDSSIWMRVGHLIGTMLNRIWAYIQGHP